MTEDSKSKSPKMDAAIARARNTNGASAAEPTALTIGEIPADAMMDAGEALAHVNAKVATGAWDAAPQLASIPVGKGLVEWLLEGNGPPAEFADEDTGVVREVQTWILSRGGIRVSILSSAQLDKKLPPYVGGLVTVIRGVDGRSGRNVYSNFHVSGESDGKPRNWATKPALPVASSSKLVEVVEVKAGTPS